MTNSYLFSKISKFFLYLVPFSVVVVYRGSLFPFIVGKYVFMRTVVELALVFFIWAWARGEFVFFETKDRRQENIISRDLLLNPLAIAVLVFIFIFLLSGFLGINPSASFWSNFERGEGGFQLLHFFAFFLMLAVLFRDIDSWKRLFLASFWAAIFLILYGVAAALKIEGFIGPDICSRFAGSLGNPAYVGTYMLFLIFYAVFLAVNTKYFIKWFYWGLTILFFAFLLLSQTRGAVLGLAAAIIIGLIYMLFSSPSKKIKIGVLLTIIILIISGVLGVIYRQKINLTPFCSGTGGSNRLLDVSFSSETYQTRWILWQQSLKAFKERPILGWGPENFNIAFEKYFDIHHTAWFDRAHNIFIDYLIFSGALGFLSFISIFASFYWRFLRNKPKSTDYEHLNRGNQKTKIAVTNYQALLSKVLIFSLPIAYLVQGLVLFDVLPIYINLFIFLAFGNFVFSEWRSMKEYEK